MTDLFFKAQRTVLRPADIGGTVTSRAARVYIHSQPLSISASFIQLHTCLLIVDYCDFIFSPGQNSCSCSNVNVNMPGYEYTFVTSLSTSLLCPLCRLPMMDAVQITTCGHRFCDACLQVYLRFEHVFILLTVALGWKDWGILSIIDINYITIMITNQHFSNLCDLKINALIPILLTCITV